ncbi:MAG: chromate transporter [Oscillospiraceae bacterium]|nr:chromate transporter [Oscillospiraceae bacterium]
MPLYLDLFLTFARVGVCTFGGGYAMLPILQREVVEKKGWATGEELTDYFAIGQCTPGVIAVNTATFVGSQRAGTLGGVIATLGLVFPSVVIIGLIAAFLRGFAHLEVVGHAFAGVRTCVCVLIFNSVLKLRKTTVIDTPTAVIFISVLLLTMLSESIAALAGRLAGPALAQAVGFLLSPAALVVLAGVCGVGIKQAGGDQT